MILQRGIDAYKWVRGAARQALKDHPLLDRTVGDALRRFERVSRLGRLLVRDHAVNKGMVHARGLVWRHVPGDVGVVSSLADRGDYEPETREFIEKVLRPGDRFVDLGAHIGFFSLLGARAVGPLGRVYAFEPIATTARLLRENAAANDLSTIVEVHELAASDEPKAIRFELHPQSSVSNKIAVEPTGETIEIAATSLDAFFEARGWPPIRLVKMDVEGAELDTLRGMKELTSRNDALAIIFELHIGNLERMKQDGHALFEILSEMGFSRFTRLLHPVEVLDGPRGIEEALRLAKRVNLNILAERPPNSC